MAGSPTQSSSDGQNSPVFPFYKLPTELLVEIFEHICFQLYSANKSSAKDSNTTARFHGPAVALARVCQHWRRVVLGAPYFWTDIHITNWSKKVKAAAHTYLERSQSCPLSLTWVEEKSSGTGALAVLNDLIVPFAERCYRMSVDIYSPKVAGPLLAGMQTLDFPILRDLHFQVSGPRKRSPFKLIIQSAPRLRRCKFVNLIFTLPLPSNLAVLDYQFPLGAARSPDILGPLLDFFPHVAHSLERLRILTPLPFSPVIPRRPRILLQNLKSLVVCEQSCIVTDNIITPNLTSLCVARGRANGLHGFHAPQLRSLTLCRVPLLPLLTLRDLPSMFPQLESVVFARCDDVSASIPLLLAPEQNEPCSLQGGSKHPPKPYPFPKLKELTVVMDLEWPNCLPSLQAAMQWQRRVDQDTHSFIEHLAQRFSDSRGVRFVITDTFDWRGSGLEVFM